MRWASKYPLVLQTERQGNLVAASTIITVLTNVPWGQVLDAAPKVAEGATKLWKAVARRKKEGSPDEALLAANAQAGVVVGHPIEDVRIQIASLQGAVDSLKDEMQSATELIKLLAEQNTVLVQRVELNRRRLVRQAMAAIVVGVAMLASILYLLFKP